MADEGRPVYCGSCGSIVQAGDQFCGVCGASIPPDAPEAIPTQEIPTLVSPPPSIPSRRRNRKLINGVMVGALLVFSLVGVGALALTGLGQGLLGGTSGGTAPSGSDDGAGSEKQEPTTSSSGPSEPSWMSDEEIAALEGFGRDYDEAVRSEDWEGTYSMLDEESRQEFTEEEWAEKQQILTDTTGFAPLEGVTVEQEEQVADGPVTVRLSFEDGTDETMTALIPQVVEDPGDAMVPKRLLTEEEISELEDLPSFPPEPTTSATPEATSPGSYTPSAEEAETEAQEAAEDYYRAAGLDDWDYTYEQLDVETRSGFSEEEWFQKNEWFADNGEVIYNIESVDQVGTSTEYLGVTLTLTYEDGSSSTRTTYFVYEDGQWKHRFGQEEQDLFMPDVPYEEFVEAQQ